MECELPNPELIWARTIAVSLTSLNIADVSDVQGALRELDEYVRVNDGRLAEEDGSGNWYVLVRLTDERALLFGGDESTDLYDTDYDPWSAAPGWVRGIDRTVSHPRLSDPVITFVRWWDGQQWDRTPLDRTIVGDRADDSDADDGLFMALQSAVDAEKFASELETGALCSEWIGEDLDTGELVPNVVDPADVIALGDAAWTGIVTREHLEFLPPQFAGAIAEYLWQTGVLAGAPRVVVPLSTS
ncbi:hypothetical protein [Nocardia sp. NPDC057668]|uniref:hypothetical protein n=1 Tax=Nocardia sp. NPDC057668 TaxID=3346202 RepID=UPI003672D3E6